MRLRLSLFATTVALLIYWLTWSGLPHAIDELSTLSVTESIAIGDGFTANQMAWDQARTPPQNAPGLDGRLYSKKGLGMSLLALPGWLLGRAWGDMGAARGALLAGAVVAAAGVGAMVWLTLALGYSRATALLAGAALGLGTLQWPFARTLFGEALAGPALAFALAGGIGARTFSYSWGQRRGNTSTLRLLLLLLCGAGLALITLAKSSNALVAPFVLLMVVAGAWQLQPGDRRRDRISRVVRETVVATLPLLIAVAITVWYNWIRFGTLFGFALESYENFSTPLAHGLAGLLFSSGKGLFWYMPLLFLAVGGLVLLLVQPRAQGGKRGLTRLDAVALLGVLLAPLLLYALWYDWPGGRSWGPRMVAWVGPAVVVLSLPWLAVLSDRARRWTVRTLVALLLAASIISQLPGVLVNFELREAYDTRHGVPFNDLLWEPAQSPLYTYWRSILPNGEPGLLDPVIAQPFFGESRRALGLSLMGGSALLLLFLGLRGSSKRQRLLLGAAFLVTLAIGPMLARATGEDPRWEDRSANTADNAALVATLRQQQPPSAPQLLILDLQAWRDHQSRAWWRANALPARPRFLGWLRKEPLAEDDSARLSHAINDAALTWLVLQETPEDDPTTTTEFWLDANSWRGRSFWLGSLRVVEYATGPATPVAHGEAVDFGEAELAVWRLARAGDDSLWQLQLEWAAPAPPHVRFSVQALDADGVVLAQVDRAPTRSPAAVDRVALVSPPAHTIVLKLYSAATDQVLHGPHGEMLPLWTQTE